MIVPPIKSQGIKTKLSPWIGSLVGEADYKRWVEPFMGTGAVAFNIQPKKALLCDSNPHLIKFYRKIQTGEITPEYVREFLQKEGKKLLDSGGEYYYEVRRRFNEEADSLDFLFLNRSCFNGMMRFNKQGGFNVPFCRKPNRFLPALITKITNQVAAIAKIAAYGSYEFKCQDFTETLLECRQDDMVYCDPPYIGRHVDYFDSWSEENENKLKKGLLRYGGKFALSTWLKNKYRQNDYIALNWSDCRISVCEHFYHLGGKEKNRNAVIEALLTNFPISQAEFCVGYKTFNKLRSGDLNASRLCFSI